MTPEKLLQEYRDRVFRWMRVGLSGNDDLAEDLTQDVFHAALKRFPDYDWSEPMALLHKMSRDRLATHYRKQGAAPGRLPEDAAAALRDMDTALLPEDVLKRAETGRAVNAALALLPAGYGEVLVAKYCEGKSVRSIAAALRKSEKAVESLLFKARREFHQLLSREAQS